MLFPLHDLLLLYFTSQDPQTPTDHPNTTTEVIAPPHSTPAADQSTYTNARLMPSSTLLSRSSAWTPELSSPDDMTLPSSNGRTASWTLTSTLSRSTAVDYTNQSTLTPSHQTTIHDCDTSNNHTICANYQREDNSTSGGSTTASTGDGEDEARFTLMISSTATGSDNSYSTLQYLLPASTCLSVYQNTITLQVQPPSHQVIG